VLALGDRLGRYELVRRLGAGGAGEVWEAVLLGPEGFRRAVALKLLRGPVDAAGRAALAREARLGAMVQHPNVVGVHDLGEADGRAYVAMELVDGVSLAAAIAARPLPPRAVLEAGLHAAAALAHLHAAGTDGGAAVVHRDVKPSNLLLDRFATVKLADLGIARLASEGGAASGTPGFAAPEQSAGHATGPRADLFALGATLAALATGRSPFGGGIPALRRADDCDALIADGLLAPVDAAVPGLAAVVARCLRRDPEARWADAGALSAALLALLRVTPPGPSLPEVLAGARPELAVPGAGASPPPDRTGGEAPTVAMIPGNLPPARDRLFGRRAEVQDVASAVRGRERLLTVVGQGGAGKTRLALAVAREVAPELPGGAWFFDLSEARGADAVCAALAAALDLQLDRKDPVHQLGRALAYRGRALFVFDNLEQLVDALPDTLARWLDLAPDATFLATSRRSLKLRGERRLPIGPLPTDDGVALFLDRAPRPPAAQEHGEVRALVEALEGLPLAIELAAARTRVLTPRRIRERLDRRLALLAGGEADRPARQRSLLAALDGSWELLSAPARAALARLTVFEGGASLEAVEGVVATDDPFVLDTLDELVDANLIRVDADGERFRLPVVVQDYAAAHLADRADAEARHARWFAAWGAPESLRALEGRGGLARLEAIGADLDNLAAASRRALAAGDAPTAVAAFLAAAEGWLARGPLTASVAAAEALLAAPLADADRSSVHAALAGAHLAAGRHGEAQPHLRAGLAAAQTAGDERRAILLRCRAVWSDAIGGAGPEADDAILAVVADAIRLADPWVLGVAWREAGGVAWAHGRHEEARARMERGLAFATAVGDARLQCSILGNLGVVSLYLGRHDDARRWLSTAEVALRTVGDQRNRGLGRVNRGLTEVQSARPDLALVHFQVADRLLAEVGDERNRATALANIGRVSRELGRWREVEAPLLEARALHRSLVDQRGEVTTCWHLANLHQERGRFDEAESLLREALAAATACGLSRAVPQVRAKLSFVAFDAGRREEALAAAAAAVAEARAADDWAAVSQTLGSWGAMALRVGDAAGAFPLLAEAMERMPDASDEGRLPLLPLYGEARALAGHGDGLADIDRAIALLRSGGFVPSLAEALLQRSRVLRRSGREPEADAARAEAAAVLAPLELPPEAPLSRLLAAS
jgi:predicted ATPase